MRAWSPRSLPNWEERAIGVANGRSERAKPSLNASGRYDARCKNAGICGAFPCPRVDISADVAPRADPRCAPARARLGGAGLDPANAASADKLGHAQAQDRAHPGQARRQAGEGAGAHHGDGGATRAGSGNLQGGITVLERRQTRIQVDLDVKRARAPLDRRASCAPPGRGSAACGSSSTRGRRVLAARLRELYEGDRPDLVSVVLSARGFSDLLESGPVHLADRRAGPPGDRRRHARPSG